MNLLDIMKYIYIVRHGDTYSLNTYLRVYGNKEKDVIEILRDGSIVIETTSTEERLLLNFDVIYSVNRFKSSDDTIVKFLFNIDGKLITTPNGYGLSDIAARSEVPYVYKYKIKPNGDVYIKDGINDRYILANYDNIRCCTYKSKMGAS